MTRAPMFIVLTCVAALAGACEKPLVPDTTTPAAPPASSQSAAPVVHGGPITQAVARISRDSYRRDLLDLAHPRHHTSAPEGLASAKAYIAGVLRSAGFTVTEQAVQYGGATAYNVIGERASAASSEVAMVSAHYDAVIGTDGADDDASGVAGMLAVARAVSEVKTPATLRMVAFAFEEEGLVGSRAYVASLSEAERKRIRGVINLEMIGYVDHARGSQRYPEEITGIVPRALLPSEGDFLGVLGSDDPGGPMDAVEHAQAYVPGLRVMLVPSSTAMLLTIPDLERSDHAPFWRVGVPALIAGDTADFRTPHYHRPSDQVPTLDVDFAKDVARLATAATLILAGTKER